MHTASKPCFATAVALAFSIALQADQIGKPGPDPRWEAVERAFEAAKSTRDLSQVKAELLKFFQSPSPDVKNLGLNWVGYHENDLTPDEMDDLDQAFIQANPEDSYSVRATIALRHLDRAPGDERRVVYMSAIRNGSVKVDQVADLRRDVALGRAAAEGLDEFRPFIEQYRAEIDRSSPADPCKRSEKLLWLLKMREGAADRNDAVRLHAERLAEMDSDTFAHLMASDTAFRSATVGELEVACDRPLSDPCRNMAKLAVSQRDRQSQRAVAAATPGPESKEVIGQKDLEAADWLDGLEHATAAARTKIALEKTEAQTRQH